MRPGFRRRNGADLLGHRRGKIKRNREVQPDDQKVGRIRANATGRNLVSGHRHAHQQERRREQRPRHRGHVAAPGRGVDPSRRGQQRRRRLVVSRICGRCG